jgi:hypothetical protein
MPEDTSNDKLVRLLPSTMPGLPAPALDEWHGRGMCVGEDPDVFFPSHGDPGTDAREICAACQVRGDCLKYGTEADEFGIWGGLDQQERRSLRRKQLRRIATSRTGNSRTRKAEGAA